MQIIDGKALLLKLRNPKRVTEVIPKSKTVEDHEVLVKWVSTRHSAYAS